MKSILYAIESHEQLLQIWRDLGLTGLGVVHTESEIS